MSILGLNFFMIIKYLFNKIFFENYDFIFMLIQKNKTDDDCVNEILVFLWENLCFIRREMIRW